MTILTSEGYHLRRYSCRIIYRFILIVLLFSFQSITNAQPTLVLNTTGQPPLNTETHDGFMDQVAREAIKRIGYQLIINRLPAERGLRNANSGLIDGEMSRVKGINHLYPNLIRVPEKIMDWELVVFSKEDIKLQSGWNSLVDKNIAFITGWKILEKNAPQSANITKTRNARQLFTLLEKNRVDLIVYEGWGGNYLLNQLQIDSIYVQLPALKIKAMYMYLHKKHAVLVPQLAHALLDMKRDGSYEQLEKKYLNPISKK